MKRGDFVIVPMCRDVGVITRTVDVDQKRVRWFGAGCSFTEDSSALQVVSLERAEAIARTIGVELPCNGTDLGGEA